MKNKILLLNSKYILTPSLKNILLLLFNNKNYLYRGECRHHVILLESDILCYYRLSVCFNEAKQANTGEESGGERVRIFRARN